MAYLPEINGFVSTNNSTSTPLTGSASWPGTGEDVSIYSNISVYIYADVIGTVNFEFSTDNSNWETNKSVTIEASEAHEFILPVTTKYFRINYTNGTSAHLDYKQFII
jgi:hypothetical protein